VKDHEFLPMFPMAFGFLALAFMTSLVTLPLSLVPLIYTHLVIEMAAPKIVGSTLVYFEFLAMEVLLWGLFYAYYSIP
jgi:hypothetical protein